MGAVIPHPGYLILRLRSYPAWKVGVNGRPVVGMPQREDGLIAVPVQQGPVEVAIDWIATPDVLLAAGSADRPARAHSLMFAGA